MRVGGAQYSQRCSASPSVLLWLELIALEQTERNRGAAHRLLWFLCSRFSVGSQSHISSFSLAAMLPCSNAGSRWQEEENGDGKKQIKVEDGRRSKVGFGGIFTSRLRFRQILHWAVSSICLPPACCSEVNRTWRGLKCPSLSWNLFLDLLTICPTGFRSHPSAPVGFQFDDPFSCGVTVVQVH